MEISASLEQILATHQSRRALIMKALGVSGAILLDSACGAKDTPAPTANQNQTTIEMVVPTAVPIVGKTITRPHSRQEIDDQITQFPRRIYLSAPAEIAVPEPVVTAAEDLPAMPIQFNPDLAEVTALGAVNGFKAYGVPASITIAQAILETLWGNPKNIPPGSNNLFGIKWVGEGEVVYCPTQEFENGRWVTKIQPFRKFASFEDGIEFHGQLIAQGSPYRKAQQLIRTNQADYKPFAAALTNVYATDPEYGDKLVNLIEKYNLAQFDQFVHKNR